MSQQVPHRRSAVAGFSLIEALLVLAILALILVIAIPSFRAVMVRNRLLQPLRDSERVVSVARLQAINAHAIAAVVFHKAGASDEFASRPFANLDTLVVFLDRNSAGVDPDTPELNGNGFWNATNNEAIITTYTLPPTARFYNPSGDYVENDKWDMVTRDSLGNSVTTTTHFRVLFNATGGLASGKETGTLAGYIADRIGNNGRMVFNTITGQVVMQKHCPGIPETNKWLPESQSNRWEWVY